MKNNKILLISSEFPPLPGGIGNHALNLAVNLQLKGMKVSVLTNQRSKKITDDINFDKIQIFKIRRVIRNRITVFTYFDRFIKAFFLVKENHTIITSGKFSIWMGGVLKIFFWNRNWITVLHGSEINAGGYLSKKISSWSVERHNKIVAVSNFTKQLMLQNNPKLNIEVINNGFVIPKNTDIKDTDLIVGHPSIITIGNVTYRKGQQNVIRALPSLKQNHPQIHYHIIGIPTEMNSFTELAKKLDVLENISFHTSIPDSQKDAILKQAKVFFMLSDNLKNGDVEGFGIAVLEANALKIPAIGSKNTGIADAIKDNFSGKLVNPHDVNEISNAFDEIMSNYETYSKNASKWSGQFLWDSIIKQYLEIIER